MRQTLLLLYLLSFAGLFAQTAEISGTVRDDRGSSVPGATVFVRSLGIGVSSDEEGIFSLEVPSEVDLLVEATFTGYLPFKEALRLTEGEQRELSIVLGIRELRGVDIVDEAIRYETLERIPIKVQRKIPSPTGGIESLLTGQLGVATNNELSSTYSVRGGSFDENLVYVNDIEVYRPFLTRSGNQEGFSFANPDLVSDILFSAGGFDARYGDKMSSVLDITYKRPTETEGSFQAGILGGALHLGGQSKNRRLHHITGLRYRTNQYLLGSLDEQGDYGQRFIDAQTLIGYGLSDKWKVEFLGNIAQNRYNFIPQDRTTQLGSINEALQLTVFFEGQEITEYETYFGALSFTHEPNPKTRLKFITSAFQTYEEESFDILGQYRLDELERDLGSDEFGEVVRNLGIGGYLDHARNLLDATVFNFQHRGLIAEDGNTLEWGLSARNERISDRLSEWNLVDSAGYSIPHDPNGQIVLDDLIRSENDITSQRFTAFVQHRWDWQTLDSSNWSVTLGGRGNHWTFNSETVLSPRGRVSYRPKRELNRRGVQRDVVYKFATGLYYQPAFYRELRDLNGDVNPDIQAQQAFHVVLGQDRMIELFGRPFRWISEAYYKRYDRLIPYELENVRLRYFAENNARGYALGLDTKLNGEFLKGVQSWANLSVMTAQEDILDDFYTVTNTETGVETTIEPGFIPRPTDQRVFLSMFFQDEMPKNPSFKVQLSFHYGTGLPFGPPSFDRFRDTLRTTSYRRVDIGFIKQFISADRPNTRARGVFSHMKEAWVALEIFNLLDVPNVQSYLWVGDIRGRQYAVPNFLTPRLVNLRVYFRF